MKVMRDESFPVAYEEWFARKFEFQDRGSVHEHTVKALTPIEDFNEHFQCELSDEEFDTIGGLVMHAFGRLPGREESIDLGPFQFTVLSADGRTIRLLRVTHRQDDPALDASPE